MKWQRCCDLWVSIPTAEIGGISFAGAGMTCRACQKEGFRYVTGTATAPDRHSAINAAHQELAKLFTIRDLPPLKKVA